MDTCPDREENGFTIPADRCTSDTLQPRSGETRKRFGCICQGLPGDQFSQYVCETAQPWTHWIIELRGANGSALDGDAAFGAYIYERAGTPANVCNAPLTPP